MKKKKRTYDEGFTFVETLAVIAVTAILAAQTGVAVQMLVQKAKCSAARTNISMFESALQSYYVDCGVFPTMEQGLAALWKKPLLVPVPDGWNGPYLSRNGFSDSWGTPFVYLTSESSLLPAGTPEGLPFVIESYGADCKEGGSGNGKDIISWE